MKKSDGKKALQSNIDLESKDLKQSTLSDVDMFGSFLPKMRSYSLNKDVKLVSTLDADIMVNFLQVVSIVED